VDALQGEPPLSLITCVVLACNQRFSLRGEYAQKTQTADDTDECRRRRSGARQLMMSRVLPRRRQRRKRRRRQMARTPLALQARCHAYPALLCGADGNGVPDQKDRGVDRNAPINLSPNCRPRARGRTARAVAQSCEGACCAHASPWAGQQRERISNGGATACLQPAWMRALNAIMPYRHSRPGQLTLLSRAPTLAGRKKQQNRTQILGLPSQQLEAQTSTHRAKAAVSQRARQGKGNPVQVKAVRTVKAVKEAKVKPEGASGLACLQLARCPMPVSACARGRAHVARECVRLIPEPRYATDRAARGDGGGAKHEG